MTNDINAQPATAFADSANECAEPIVELDFETALMLEARQFEARSQVEEGKGPSPLRLIVVDLEFAYDRDAYEGYKVAEGAGAEKDIRWPFHSIACASWMILRLDPRAEVPVVEEVTTLANDEASEAEIAARLFGVLELHPDARLITWGGESKDLAVLRRVAVVAGLLLPPQLLDPHPHSRHRLDVCRAVSGSARFPHLPEFAVAIKVPCKPAAAKEVGKLVERGEWEKVRDQCLADVLTTCVIALQHLAASGAVTCHRQRSIAAIAEAASKAMPRSAFVRSTFAPWARARLAESRLSGAIYRAG